MLLGQALIQQDLCAQGWPGRAGLAALLARGDVVFTDLETAIDTPGGGAPTRQGEVLHAAPPVVLDCLKGLGVSLVNTGNNHAWDLGTAGIAATLTALDARRIHHAGSGADLASASAAGVQSTPYGKVSLVAVAAGAIREGAAATDTRPGVAELRRGIDGVLDSADVARTLDAIRLARRRGETVIACLHNHYWEKDPAITPAWQRVFARQCVDAGAGIFVAHGPPLLQGIERYKGAPLLHGLGSLIFQTRKTSYGPEAWQSLIVDARFRNGAFVQGTAIPVALDPSRSTSDAEFTSGVPSIATGAQSRDICRRVVELSAGMGIGLAVGAGTIAL
jgi:poly-gamma-glutamate synthesis protein (capsule biosynthesis protein)